MPDHGEHPQRRPFRRLTLVSVGVVLALVAFELVLQVLAVVAWLSSEGGATPRQEGLPVALCLLVFHGLLAAMAVTPHSATVHPDVLRRWLQRTGAVAVATGIVWLLVGALERRDAPANPQLTLLALLVAGVGVVLLLRRSLVDADT